MEILKITIFACLAVAAFLPCGVKAQDCSAIADLTDVQLFVLGNQLVVVWQEPSNLITCGFENVQHIVTYIGYQSEQDTTTPDYYVYFDYYPYSCVPSVVTITTSSGDLSTSTRVEYYTETSKVDNLAVSKVESGTLVASWSKPADSEYCDFVYLVTYQDENSNPLSIETTDLETDLGVSISSCALATITVTPINRQYAGIAVTTGYEGDINPVRNYGLEMVAAEIIAQFDPPLDIENCDITYEVREVEDDCYTKNVSVAAFNGRIYSPWTTDSIETEIASLAGVSASVNSNVIEMSWTAPLDAETCSITYQVEFDGTTYTTSESNLAFEVEALDACGSMAISVSAVSSTGKVGAASDVAVQGQLGAIQNLVMESLQEGNALVATWDAPENSSSCKLSYLLEYTNGTGSHIYVTTDNTYTFAYEPCIEVTLSVTPHSEDGSVGPKATITFTANIEAVTDLTADVQSDQLVISWSHSNTCPYEYKVNYIIDNVIIPEAIVGVTTMSFDYVYCVDAVVSVIPTIDSEDGPERAYPVPAEYPTSAAVESATIVTENGKQILRWEEIQIEACDVTYDIYIISEELATTPHERTAYGDFEIPEGEFCYNVIARITPRFGTYTGVYFDTERKVVSLEKPESLELTPTDTVLVAKWEHDLKQGYCSISYDVSYQYGSNLPITVQDITLDTYDIPLEDCTDVIVSVTAVSGSESSEPATETFKTDIEAVTDLTADVLSDQLVVSWSHSKANTCPFEYKVKYIIEGIVIAEDIVGVTTKSFDYVYCVDAVVSVIPTIDSEDGPEIPYPVPAKFPGEITEKVTNVVITPDEDTQQLTWDDLVIGRCSVVYKVQIISDDIDETHYNEESPYSIRDEEICYNLDARVAAGIDIGTDILYGPASDSIAKTVVMPAVSDLEYSVDSDKLTATWQHYKHSICALEYRVEYTPNGRSSATTETSSTEAELDFVSCAEGVLSVTPIATGARTGTTDSIDISYDVSPQFDAVDVIATVKQTDGSLLLTWTEKDFGECTVQYNVVVTGIGVTTHNDAISPILIDFDDFCSQIEVAITPIVDTVTGKVALSVITTDCQ